jgi:hypothetical protein
MSTTTSVSISATTSLPTTPVASLNCTNGGTPINNQCSCPSAYEGELCQCSSRANITGHTFALALFARQSLYNTIIRDQCNFTNHLYNILLRINNSTTTNSRFINYIATTFDTNQLSTINVSTSLVTFFQSFITAPISNDNQCVIDQRTTISSLIGILNSIEFQPNSPVYLITDAVIDGNTNLTEIENLITKKRPKVKSVIVVFDNNQKMIYTLLSLSCNYYSLNFVIIITIRIMKYLFVLSCTFW